MKNILIKRVKISQILELRTKLLRPGQWPKAEIYQQDNIPSTRHYHIQLGEQIVAVATFILLPPPDSLITTEELDRSLRFIRLRGMGVSAEFRRRGFGRTLLERAIKDFVDESDSSNKQQTDKYQNLLWFHARQSAFQFYQSMGFHTHGDFFNVPNIGPHKIMWKTLK